MTQPIICHQSGGCVRGRTQMMKRTILSLGLSLLVPDPRNPLTDSSEIFLGRRNPRLAEPILRVWSQAYNRKISNTHVSVDPGKWKQLQPDRKPDLVWRLSKPQCSHSLCQILLLCQLERKSAPRNSTGLSDSRSRQAIVLHQNFLQGYPVLDRR